MLLSVEVSSSCCAAAWLSHAGSPCPSSSLICSLLPLDQSHRFIYFFPHPPSCHGFVSLSFANLVALFPAFPHHLRSSPFEANCGRFLPLPCWHVSVVPMDIVTSLPMRLAVDSWQKQSLSPTVHPVLSQLMGGLAVALGGNYLDFHLLPWGRVVWASTAPLPRVCGWRSLEPEKILRWQPEPRPEMGVRVGTRYKTSVLVLPVWQGTEREHACPEVWWRFTLMGVEAWPDVVLPLQQPSCNGSRCPCEELALPIWPVCVLELIYHH